MNISSNIYHNIEDIIEKYPDHTAFYYQDKKIKYKELQQMIFRIGNYFEQLELKKDDVITLVAPNTPEAVACFFAASMLDLKIHLLHPLTLEKNLIKELKEKKSKLLITVSIFLNSYRNILKMDIPVFVLNPASSLNIIKRFAFSKLNKKQLIIYNQNKKINKYDDFKETEVNIKDYSPKKGRIFLSSGGTSGDPKTIVLSDFAILSLISKAPEILGISEEEVSHKTMLGALPMFHGFGLVMGILAVLNYGGSVALFPKFNTKPVIKVLKQGHLNMIIGVPIMFEALLRNPSFNGKMLKNIDVCFIGGDFISPSLLERFNKKLKYNGSSALLLEGYGLTETVTVLSVNTIKHHRDGSVGKPLSEIDVKILDDNNRVLPSYEKGEIAISSPTLMQGYLNEIDPFIYINGKKYVKSGDIGYLDSDNYLYFINRKKRVIKKRGFNIFPLSIEKYVSSLKNVKECAYLSKNNGKEEITYLFIAPEDNIDTNTLKEEILSNLKQEFQTYEIPDYIMFEKEFKKTNVGKIDYVYLATLIK